MSLAVALILARSHKDNGKQNLRPQEHQLFDKFSMAFGKLLIVFQSHTHLISSDHDLRDSMVLLFMKKKKKEECP